MAGTIDAFAADIMMQPGLVESAGSGLALPPPIPDRLLPRSVFCGSGDSLAASMLAEAFSDLAVRSADPLEVAANAGLYRRGGARLYVVSVSGNTASGIRAANAVPGAVAVTADTCSRLARSCSETVPVEYPSSGVTTAGSVGFLASVLACISLVGRLAGGRPPVRGAGALLDAARREAARFGGTSGRTFVLGDRLTYPVAAYCAAKFSEVLGAPCQYERTEQFSHAGMFSARKGDTVVVLEGPSPRGRRLAEGLEGLGLGVVVPEPPHGGGDCNDDDGDDDDDAARRLRHVLYMIFFSQFLVLNKARSLDLDDCHFVSEAAARDASSEMIY